MRHPFYDLCEGLDRCRILDCQEESPAGQALGWHCEAALATDFAPNTPDDVLSRMPEPLGALMGQVTGPRATRTYYSTVYFLYNLTSFALPGSTRACKEAPLCHRRGSQRHPCPRSKPANVFASKVRCYAGWRTILPA